MVKDLRTNGLKEKLRYLQDEVVAVHSDSVTERRKAALNVGAWIYAIEQQIRRFKNLDRVQFEATIQPVTDVFLSNPTINWWLQVRHRVVHDTPPGFITSTHISHLDSNMINQLAQSAPSGTVGIFFGDALGGSGWEVTGKDGEYKVYFALPKTIGSSEVNFPSPPSGKTLEKLADESLDLTTVFVHKTIAWVKSI